MWGHFGHGGFGNVTEQLGAQFLARGIDVRVLAVDYKGQPFKGPLYGHMWRADMYGSSHGTDLSGIAIDGRLWTKLDSDDHWQPDVVFVISDMSGFLGHVGSHAAVWATVPVFHYCPIEGDNLAPDWAPVWRKVETDEGPRQFAHPVAMATYGADQIEKLTGERPPVIYHAVDLETFHPVSPAAPVVFEGKTLSTKEACKAMFGLDPNKNIILRSDRNVPRKFYDRFIAAMALVLEREPNTEVVIHCAPEDEGGSLPTELIRQPEHIRRRIKLTNMHDTWTGLPTEGMVALMNAADLYVSTTSGEGFGLNLAESLACGVPVVVTDWAAEREVVGPGGIMVPVLHDSYGEPVRFHSKYGMDWGLPDPRGFVEPVLSLLAKPARRRAMGQEGRMHVKRMFSWDTSAEQFIALFEEAHARTSGPGGHQDLSRDHDDGTGQPALVSA